MTTHPTIRPMEDARRDEVERSRGASIQVLLGPDDGAPNFATRRFTIEPGGRIPRHRHSTIEHQQVVLEGRMVLELDGRFNEVGPGDCVFIPAGVAHAYENRGSEPIRFLCIVPLDRDYETEWLEPAAE